MKLLRIILAALICVAPCMAADTYTTNYNFRLPDLDVEDEETPWGLKYNNNWTLVDSAIKSIVISTWPVTANIAGGAADSMPIQSAASVTTFIASTSSATGNTIVRRDASGNFSAGTIYAAAVNIAGGAAGQIPMQSAASVTTFHTPTSNNTASAIVQRDAAGNFNAGTIGATAYSLGSIKSVYTTAGNDSFHAGWWSSPFNPTGLANTFIGAQAALSNTTGARNTVVGTGAINRNATGTDNTVVGALNAGYLGSTADVSSNTIVGSRAATLMTGGADKNVIMGTNSGYAVTTGSGNVVIGYNAAPTLSTGNSNIIIGQSAAVASAGGNNYLNIGGAISGYMAAGSTITFTTDISAPIVKGSTSTATYLIASGTLDIGAELVTQQNNSSLVATAACTVPNKVISCGCHGAGNLRSLKFTNSTTSSDYLDGSTASTYAQATSCSCIRDSSSAWWVQAICGRLK